MCKILAAFALSLITALGACASKGPPVDKIPPFVNPDHVHFTEAAVTEGDPAPDFTLKSQDGNSEVTLSALRGKPVVLIFGSYT